MGKLRVMCRCLCVPALLQAYLAEQGYLNADGGLTGYFSDTTRDALISWQQHQGLPLTGVFAQDCKWAVLRQQVGHGRGRGVPRGGGGGGGGGGEGSASSAAGAAAYAGAGSHGL